MNLIPMLIAALVGSVLGLGLVFGLGWLLYFFVSLPMRRDERARLFLDVVETGLRQGRSLERTIVSASAAGDRVLGARFHLLAAYLERGMSLAHAFDQVPHLLPPALRATLRAGAEAICLPKVLEACRRQLRDGTAQVWKSQHFLALMALIATPVWLVVFWTLVIFVFPKFQQIGEEMGAESWPLLHWLVGHAGLLISVQVLLFGGFYLAVLAYVGGPRITSWLDRIIPGAGHHLALALPWRRQRILRNFSATLAVLLDAGLPEPRALTLAAESTSNRAFEGRAADAVAGLEKGLRLPDAVQRLDDTGEFRWRLENAARSGSGFGAALAGWHEALDARAFHQEQIVSQLATTALVLVNGVMVACVAIAVFQLLISIIKGGLLW